MVFQEIREKIDVLGRAWEEFKRVNDQRLTEIEQRGSADPLHLEQLDKINQTIDTYQARLQELEQYVVRPIMSAVSEFSHPHQGHPNHNGQDPASAEHKKAFHQFLRKGIDTHLSHMERKALSTQVDADGGYLVTPSMSRDVVRHLVELSPLRSICAVETISTDSLEVMEDTGEAGVGWTTETTLVTDDTPTPHWGKKIIPVHEMFAQPKATQKLLDDAAFDIESWLNDKLTQAFASSENYAFVKGDGNGKPRGFCSYPEGHNWGQIEQVSSGQSGAISGDALLAMYYSLKQDYAANAKFVMHRFTVQALRQIKVDSAGSKQYLWQPGLSAGTPDTLLGIPVIQIPDMETMGAGKLVIALGDFKRAYRIVDRMGIRVFRDPYTNKPFVKFYSTKRVGGDVTNYEALKLMRIDI
ncbi:MAG: phage major capsid protein [Alphaproteobacteria bacterium]|nr:phage major capsid protein [Alphaproteobacteria bacterium]